MSAQVNPAQYRWLQSGDEIFPPMLQALECAREEIRLEVYIYANDRLGVCFRNKLLEATRRGVKVRVLIDAFGSMELPSDFWDELRNAGGKVKIFNPFWLKRLGFRDHRKMLVCDSTVAFAGGYNIAHEYEGDGVKTGWCELAVEIRGEPVLSFLGAFDEMFEQADEPHPWIGNRAHAGTRKKVMMNDGELLLGGPGLIGSPFKRILREDLSRSLDVRIVAAYFLPTARIRRELLRVIRRGGRVRLILPAKSDVGLSQLAAHGLYRRLLKAGVEVYEYQPQVLHAKLIIADQIVFAGSSNLDPRSLLINYELMLRITESDAVRQAQDLFETMLQRSRRIELAEWIAHRTFWSRLRGRWASFLLGRLDPLVARWYLGRNRYSE